MPHKDQWDFSLTNVAGEESTKSGNAHSNFILGNWILGDRGTVLAER